MKTKFFKIATIVALGAVSFLSSCNKEEIDNEINESPKINYTSSDSLQNLLDVIKNDTDLVSYSIIDASDIIEDGELRRQTEGAYLSGYYFNDLKLYSKSSRPATYLNTSDGTYKKIDMDLNMGAGGDYVYLYYQTTQIREKAISYIDGYYNTSSYKSGSTMVIDAATGNIGDCNKGTKGGRIALGIRKDNQRHIYALVIAAYKSSKNNYCEGYRRVASDLDMNKGAGGRYIYIFALWN